MYTIRAIEPSEFPAWIAALHVPFFMENPIAPEVEFRLRYVDLSRCSAAFDDGRIVATYRSFATDVSVPGGLLDASAVTMVTVMPTHRRRGLLTAMMRPDLRASAERGEPIAILIASEFPIYGRYGFGPANDQASYELPGGAAFVDGPASGPAGRSGGAVDYVEATVFRELAPGLYDRSRRDGTTARAGQIVRRDVFWDALCGLVEPPWPAPKPGRIVLHRDEQGIPQGYLRYHVEDVWEEGRPASVLHVDDLITCTAGAEALLWRFVAGIDLVRTIRAADRPADETVRWLLRDARTFRQLHRVDGLWVRVLDVPGALAGRRYAVDGSLVIEVVDPDGYAAGQWRLDGGPNGAACARTSGTPDLVLPVTTLGACFLGGRSFAEFAVAGLVTESRAGACAVADAMFHAAPLPWCSTGF
jgi:predicted acetyltransferase